MTIGENIKRLRKEQGLTQKELGDLCGMADSAIRRYESDRGNPTEKTLTRIASALGVPREVLSFGTADFSVIEKWLGEPVFSSPDEEKAFYAKIQRDLEIRDAMNIYSKIVQEEKARPKFDLILSDEFIHNQHTIRLLFAFNHLNDEGKRIAIERLEELELIPKYQRPAPADLPTTPTEGNTPTIQEKPPEGQTSPTDGK